MTNVKVREYNYFESPTENTLSPPKKPCEGCFCGLTAPTRGGTFRLSKEKTLKYHVQMERTIDIIVEADDRRALEAALARLTGEEGNALAVASGSDWQYFIGPPMGPAKAAYIVTDEQLKELP